MAASQRSTYVTANASEPFSGLAHERKTVSYIQVFSGTPSPSPSRIRTRIRAMSDDATNTVMAFIP